MEEKKMEVEIFLTRVAKGSLSWEITKEEFEEYKKMEYGNPSLYDLFCEQMEWDYSEHTGTISEIMEETK